MRKLLTLSLLFVSLLTMRNSCQSVGDYGTGQASVAWNTANNWVICVTAGTWDGASTATSAPASTNTVWIRGGNTANIGTSGSQYCKDLHIDAGGAIVSGNANSSPKYLKVYGNVYNNGTMGGAADGFSIQVNTSTMTISGAGTSYVCRFQPFLTSSITIDMNLTNHYSSGAGLYCNSYGTTVTINPGRSVILGAGTYWAAGPSSTGDPSSGANNLTMNIYGSLTMNNKDLNLSNTSSYTTNLHVYNGGVINCSNGILGSSSSAAAAINVTIDAGGSLNFTGAGGTCDLSKAATTMNGTVDFNNTSTTTRSLGATANIGGIIRTQSNVLATAGTLNLNTGSTVEYYGTSAIALGTTPLSYSNLTINNSAGVSLGTSIAVTGTLTLTNGLLILGANNLTLSNSVLGTPSASNMIVATGSGQLRELVTGNGSFTFTVGDASPQYSPVVVTLNSNSDLTSAYIGVNLNKSAFPNHINTPSAAIDRYWTLSQTGISSPDYNIALTYLPDDVTLGLESALHGWKFDSGTYLDLGAVNTATHQIVGNHLTSFSVFTAMDAAAPVELSSFTSDVSGRTVHLKWVTQTEVNFSKFIIERSNDGGKAWMAIGEVIAAGNSNSPKNYRFNDKNLNTGKYSYRLKLLDLDGSFRYSQIIESEIALPAEFELSQNYPNPFNPSTIISYQLTMNSRTTLRIYDVLGNKVRTLVDEEQAAGFHRIEFNASGLASGIYFYQLRQGNNIVTKEMFLLK